MIFLLVSQIRGRTEIRPEVHLPSKIENKPALVVGLKGSEVLYIPPLA